MEMMLESNPHKDWGTFLKNLPDFIEIDAEILPECACSASTVTIHCPVHDTDPVAEGEKKPFISSKDFVFCEEKDCKGFGLMHTGCHTPKEEKCDCAHAPYHTDNCNLTRALSPIEPIEFENLAAEVHKLYCAQYLLDNGKEYWTGGDYSKLDEKTKQYDRNIVQWHLGHLSRKG